ncbi:ATP-binding protein [Candidatus Saccharibacteria bacterium]|nr:ATP-binding protein [Candidatus Saccharibacteria bacterium]
MEENKLKRKIYDKLLAWKQASHGRTAMLVEGARRVGKSTVVEDFAKREYESYILLDFNKAPLMIKKLFSESRDDLNQIFSTLETFARVKLVERRSVIIFDEVQLCPDARSLIKYLVEDGRYDYIETGSLISLRKNVQDIVIPSEEERLRMYPLDFEEFLWAMGDEMTMPFVREKYQKRAEVGVLHREIMKRFRTYMLVGGMPQAVVAYREKESFEAADIMKKAILRLYREDIHKYSDGNDDKVLAIYNGLPGQLNKQNKRFVLASISDDARGRNYEGAFDWLDESMIVNLCHNTTDPSVGLALSGMEASVKCYSGDTGLLVTQVFYEKPYLDNKIYRDILLDKLGVNEGMIMENMVAQSLRANGYELYFYAVNDDKNAKNDMEVDFLIVQENKLNPIEVKSGGYDKHTSLDKFKVKFGKKVGTRYVLHTKDLKVDGDVVYLPLYMAGLL